MKGVVQRQQFLFQLLIAFGALTFVTSSSKASANFNDNYNPDAADIKVQRVSRFGGDPESVVSRNPASVPEPIQISSFEDSYQRPAATAGERSVASVSGNVKKDVPEDGFKLSEIKKRNGVQEVAIISSDQGFFPGNIVLTKGVPARLFLSTSSKEQAQCFVLDDFKIRRQIKQNRIEEVQFTPEVEGQYAFHCPVNGARGNILVKAVR